MIYPAIVRHNPCRFTVVICTLVALCALLHRVRNVLSSEHQTDEGVTVLRFETVEETSVSKLQELLHKHIVTVGFKCEHKPRFGNKLDGGYEICQDGQLALHQNSCLIYSFGSRNEFSFEDAVYSKHHCEIHIFDPSVRDAREYERKPRMYFHPVGLASEDGHMTVGKQNWTMMTIPSIRKMLGHTKRNIDAVKMDIEGYEWETVRLLVESGAYQNIKQLMVEFHTNKLNTETMDARDFQYMLECLLKLKAAGFKSFIHHHTNGCCGKFNVMTSRNANKFRNLCCYEVLYVNTRFT